MQDPNYTVTYNYDNPQQNQQFNSESRYFPDIIFAQTGFVITHYAKRYTDFATKTVGALSLAGVDSAKLYIKPYNSALSPIELCNGVVSGDGSAGLITFTVPNDVVSNSLSAYTQAGKPTPIVLYWVIKDSVNEKAISLETNIRVMDINRNGTEEVVAVDASGISYSVEQVAKWNNPYYGTPDDVQEALDRLARVDRTDRGIAISFLGTQPASPSDGDLHVATATAGDWTNNRVYEWNSIASEWLEYTPRDGDEIYNTATDKRMRFNGSTWVEAVDHAISNATLTSATVATGDLILGKDISDSNKLKSFTAQSIANLKVSELSEDTTPQLSGDLDCNGHMVQQSIGANLSSASTLTIGTDGNSFSVTGTTTINEFSAVKVGTQITLFFVSALTLTHHATNLILTTGANIVTEAGDIAIFEEYATGDWICIDYNRKSGRPLASIISDTAYAGSWNGSTTIAPSQNAVYDKIETITTKTNFITVTQAVDLDTMESDIADAKGKTDFITITQGIDLDTIATDVANSKLITDNISVTFFTDLDAMSNDVYNSKLITDNITVTQAVDLDTMESDLYALVDDTAYGVGWDADTTHAPSRNAVYDKIESLRIETYQVITILAGSLIPASTNGAQFLTKETATNKVNRDYLAFDASTIEYACINMPFPEDWDLGTIKAKFYWTDAVTSGTGDVIWGIQGTAVSNDDTTDVAYGTAQTVTDTFITSNDNHLTSATASITISGTPALGDMIQLRIYRDATSGSDTYTQDAGLLAVTIQYGVKTTTISAW